MSVISVAIDVKQLVALGREFPWPRPAACPVCGERLWWHGFVLAYLACVPEAVFLRRLRCPRSRHIHRLRPATHWSRFQSSVHSIEETIAHRQQHGRWRADLPRPRQRQWWRRLRRKVRLCLGLDRGGGVEAFHALLKLGSVPVSRVMKCGDLIAG